MTADECVHWIRVTIESFLPSDDMVSGDVSLRLPHLMTAAVSVGTGSAFGLVFPAAARAESIARATPLIEQALQVWRTWLEEHFGDEGRAFFERAAINHGLARPAPKVLGEDAAISRAFMRLRSRLADTPAATGDWRARRLLEEDEAHGYAIAPPALDAGELLAAFEIEADPLPAALEALYAEMNGLWTGAVDGPGGERPFDEGEEYFVFMTLEGVLAHHDDRDDGLIIVNQHPDYFSWTMLSRDDGAVYQASKLDGGDPPEKIAASLVEYLDQLAATYGSPY
jgi:hypothetical protein